MAMHRFRHLWITAALAGVFFSYTTPAMAKNDLSIGETDLTFSKNEPLDGQTVTIYARAFNNGDGDISGRVVFIDNGKNIGTSQPISLRANTYDDVFVIWKAVAGNHRIEAKITKTNPVDDNSANNIIVSNDIFVDTDTNNNGIGDKKDPDIDGDGLSNDQETIKGTDPRKADTDGDGISDKVDAFPLDKTEWHDTDSDGMGDNKDPDADGDTLTNQDEVHQYGTNPLNPDSDGDGVSDSQEIKNGTNPNKADNQTIDASKWQAALGNSLSVYFGDNQNYGFWALGITALCIMLFLFKKKKRKSR